MDGYSSINFGKVIKAKDSVELIASQTKYFNITQVVFLIFDIFYSDSDNEDQRVTRKREYSTLIGL